MLPALKHTTQISANTDTKTWHIHVQGQVQGVGFRPFVWHLAQQYALQGWVNNAADGVHVVFNAEASLAKAFYADLVKQAPKLARIVGHKLEKTTSATFHAFEIVTSDQEREANLLLTPDFALCADCRAELHDATNCRYRYPFITCTNCGPRFSIIKKLPYDRERTTMQSFTMCLVCQSEYEEVTDRRYYSQTNSCTTCGIQLQFTDTKTNTILDHPLEKTIQYLRTGKIGAVKGIGGYLLLCDATNALAIQTLRARKHRPTKPLALLYPNEAVLALDAIIRPSELATLQSPEAPIVLLDLLAAPKSGIQTEIIAPGLSQIGVMLPYAPLLELIAKDFGKPLVATSGNISGSPIIFRDEQAREALGSIADFILLNNREIVMPQDDSVVQFSQKNQQKIILRRSRGLAPTFIEPSVLKKIGKSKISALAMGASMKSTFSWAHRGNLYISPYLGDLESYDTQQHFRGTLAHFLQLFDARPAQLIVDKHPAYFSTHLGEELAERWEVPITQVQHHEAHAAAVLAENDLLEAGEPVLCIVWDGTGYGHDGQVWGGEFFRCDEGAFLRAYYFDYFPFILSDKMPREPRISALCLAHDVMGADAFLEPKFTETEWHLYRSLLQQHDGLQTSSVGRLFDGVASLLGIADKVSYEGEAAMQLETLAKSYFRKHGFAFSESYIMEGASYYRVPTQTLVQNIIFDLQKGRPLDFIAAKFHYSLVIITKNVARNTGCKKLAFSGGVFQNALLVDLMIHTLEKEFELYFHQQLSPNDECVSFGQIMMFDIIT